MQKITIIALGKLNQSYYAQGVAEYAKRLQAFCNFEIIELPEETIDEKSASPAAIHKALEKEAKQILQAVPKGAVLVPLCIEGKQIDSLQFADMLAQQAVGGNGSVAFIIGSSHGLAEAVKSKAMRKLSLSKLTMPHQLARLVLTEQIYRAFMILANSKYHK